MSERLLLRVEEAAELCGLGRSKFYELVVSGEIESVKVGAARRIPRVALDAFIEKLRASARVE